MDSVLEIGSQKQLFLDERLCAAADGVRLVMNRPERDGRALLAPGPWARERGVGIGSYCSVLDDGGKIRLWYFAAAGRDRRWFCYAESENGVDFSRPRLDPRVTGIPEPENAVIGDPVQGGCVWVDPLAPPEARYRTQAKWGPPARTPEKGEGMVFYASPDGIAWRETHDLHIGDCDTQSVISHDPAAGRYVMYTRRWKRFDDPNLGYRMVRRLESDDLVKWENERIAWAADDKDLALARTSTGVPPVDCYGACVFRYPEAGDFYIITPQYFWHWLDRPENEKWGYSPDPAALDKRVTRFAPAVIDARLGYSRDGVDFHRAVDRGPFLAVGPDGRFDSRSAWVMPQPVFRDDQVWFYYSGHNRDHDGFVDPAAPGPLSGIGRAVLRLDGFVSAESGREGGWIMTPAVRFGAGELTLNAAASAGGCVRVEALDAAGDPIGGYAGEDCRPLCGDSVRMTVRWRSGGAAGLAGRPVRFRFRLREAKIYSFRVAGEA